MLYLDSFICQTPTHLSRLSNSPFSAKPAPKSYHPLTSLTSTETCSCLSFCIYILSWKNVQYLLSFPIRLFFFLNGIYLFIYFWLGWVFVSVRGLSLVVASGGHSSSWCVGLSLSRPLLLRSTGSRCAGSVVVAHGPSCSAACGIFPDQGSNPCPLH